MGVLNNGWDEDTQSPWLDPNRGLQLVDPQGNVTTPGGGFSPTFPGIQTYGGDDTQGVDVPPWVDEPTATPPAGTPAPAPTPNPVYTPNPANPTGEPIDPDTTPAENRPPVAGTPGSTPPGNSGINDYGFTTGGSPADKTAAAPYSTLMASLNTADGPEARAQAMDLLAQQLQKDLTADGHKVSWNAAGQMVVDGRTYELGGTNPSAGSTLAGQVARLRGIPKPTGETNPNPAPAPGGGNGDGGGPGSLQLGPPPQWLIDQMGPDYVPTHIDTSELDALPDFNTIRDSILHSNPNEDRLDALVARILDNPESLSDRDVETLKAKAAEEAAIAAQGNDEELQHFAAGANLGDSPWLAGARLSNAQSRSNTTIQANRNIDVAAADRRSSDRNAAAALGVSASQAKSSRAQTATATAMSGVLAKVGAKTTATQLNNAFDQAATSLRMSKAQFLGSYVLQNAGVEIDWAKFAQMSSEFQQNLALSIAQLKQQSDQFDAELQLELDKFQHSKDNDAWTQAQAAYAH